MGRKADYYGPPSNLSEEEVARLWEVFTRDQAKDARDQLIEHYMVLVYQTAERMANKLPAFVDINDLIGAGTLGLIDAINKFEPERGNKFATYCSTRISGAILDELRRLDWAPRLVRSRATQLDRVREDLRSKLGRAPAEDELAAAMDMSGEQFDELMRETQVKSMVSLDRKWDEDDDNELHQMEMLPDTEAVDPHGEMERREIREVAIRGLSEQEQQIVIMYYYDNLSLKDIGLVLGLSESRICQKHMQVLDFLREKFREREILRVDV